MAKQPLQPNGHFIVPVSDPSPTQTTNVGGAPVVLGAGPYDPLLAKGRLAKALGTDLGDPAAAGIVDGSGASAISTSNPAMKPTAL